MSGCAATGSRRLHLGRTVRLPSLTEDRTMADETPVFQIQRMYLKDLSLEQPNSPAILLTEVNFQAMFEAQQAQQAAQQGNGGPSIITSAN